MIEELGAETIALKDGLGGAEVCGETMEAYATQDGEFGQMENAIGILEKDDDLVTIFFASGASASAPCLLRPAAR